MSAYPNYIPDVNRFKLAGPPTHWLRKLAEFDSSLVVVPSRQGFMYRLAQRRTPTLSENLARDLMTHESDTQMLATYGLIPVTTILATANWDSPLMWQDLAERAPWRNGGADAVLDAIDRREAAIARKVDEEIDERNTHIARDGWKLFRKKIGLGRTWHGARVDHKYV